MVHLGALPGSPLHDAEAGLDGLVEGARKDLAALQAAGFDAVMFGNENDRPYEFEVDTASTATMAYVIGALRSEITRAVRRQRTVGPDELDGARRGDRRRASSARSSPAPMPPTWARGTPMPAPRCAIATGSAGRTSPSSINVSAEFAWSLDRRSLADRARSAVFSSIPDAILVSGAITGEAAAMSDLESVKTVLPDTPVLANTGVKHATVADVLRDRRRLHRRLVAEGRRQHLEPGRSGPRRRIHAARPRRAGRLTMAKAVEGRPTPLKDRLRALTTELMLIPGLSGYEGRVRRRLAAKLWALGIASHADRLGNLIATLPGAKDAPSVMLFAHMDQLGLVVRKIEANGLIRVERLGGVPEKALPSQEVLFCVGEGRDVPGLIANKSHHATTPDEKYRVLPYPELYVDAGFGSAGRSARRRHRYRHADRLRAQGGRPRRRPPRRHLGRRPRRLRGDGRGGPRAPRREATADRASGLLGAGGVQPSRRADRGERARARHRHPARPDARHRHAGHDGARRRPARRRPGDEPLQLPRPRHAQRHHPAPGAGPRCSSRRRRRSRAAAAAERPYRRADRLVLRAARRRRRRLPSTSASPAATRIPRSRSATSPTSPA